MKTYKLTKLERREDPYHVLELVPQGFEVKGIYEEMDRPEVGYPYIFRGDAGFNDVFNTSMVKEIIDESDNSVIFKTLNSIYKLELVK